MSMRIILTVTATLLAGVFGTICETVLPLAFPLIRVDRRIGWNGFGFSFLELQQE
jgi:hypothetical protein